MKCLIVQPIHPAGEEMLREAGIEPVNASAHDMETVAREIASMDAVITRNAGLKRAAMDAGNRLRVIGNHGTGVDQVDLDHATELGLPVAYIPHANVQSVAELAITHMMAIARRVREADAAVRSGNFDYRYARDFREMQGSTLLIIGFGSIGRRTAEMAAAAFAMKVLVHSPSVPVEKIVEAGFEPAPDLNEALGKADFVSLHQRLNDRTRASFNAERFARMKKGAVLVNTARGGLVDAAALIEAVESGHLRGAAIDVFETEPLPVDHPFIGCKGILLAPHIGAATEEALERMAVEIATAVIAALRGERPEYLANPDTWEVRRRI